MWWSKLIVILAVFTFFIGCKKEEASVITVHKEKSIPLSKMKETFPFSEADKVEIISYPLRYTWDTIVVNGYTRTADVVKDKKLQVNPEGIKDRIVLDNKSTKKLFKFFFTESCNNGSEATCYSPKHSVLFYNEKNEIIAYIEVCLGCASSMSSEGFDYNSLCIERMGNLRKILKDAGVKYFGEGDK